MQSVITDTSKDPLGVMLLDYMSGVEDVFAEVASSTMNMAEMTAKVMFRTYDQMDALEKQALTLCQGKILDVGAGSGCHSLYLQQNGYEVDALDISPGCIEVMRQRSVKKPIHTSLFLHNSYQYNTILMLMNGVGICGTIDGLNLFLQYIPTILAEGGQVLVDSTDLFTLFDDKDAADREQYLGETEFQIRYKDIVSEPFDWLYIDFSMLETLARFHGISCERLYYEENGRFLARIVMNGA